MEEIPMSMKIPELPLFFSVFIFIYLIAYFVVFRKWSPDTRPEASSCLISLFHGTPAAFLAARAIFRDSTRSFSSPNSLFQNTVLDYSIAYFLTDLLHYVVFFPRDVLFIGHHVATLFVFLTCRYVAHHGACAILGLLFLAEVTSLCQNTWTLAGIRRREPHPKTARKVYDLLSPPFYAFYSLVRGIFGPVFVWKMLAFYAGGGAKDLIPKWIWFSWIVVIVIAISVSILWIWNLWVELFRENRARLEKGKKNR